MGATGETGKPLLEQILENGHSVTAMVRDTNKICTNHPKLTKITGDIFDPNVLAPIIRDHDVVVSVLGFPKQIDQPMTKFTDSMEAILKAMKMSKVQRIVTISAWYTNPNTRQGSYQLYLIYNCSMYYLFIEIHIYLEMYYFQVSCKYFQ